MKNITLSADEHDIEEARAAARSRNTSLNELFRDWIKGLAAQKDRETRLAEIFERVSYAKSHGPYTREEMNER